MNALALRRKVGEQMCLPQGDMTLIVQEVRGRKFRRAMTALGRIAVVGKDLCDGSPQHSAHPVDFGTDADLASASQAE